MKNLQIYFLLLTLFVACDSFVDVDLPDSQQTGAAVFEDRATATAALVDIYSKLRDTGLLSGSLMGSSVQLGLYADELDYYGMGGMPAEAVYNNNLLPSTSIVGQLWSESYNQVYCANAVIESVENSMSLTMEDKAQLKGEALFIRTLVHFYLLNVFGDIPYITTTDYEQNRLAMRMPQEDVYVRIVADLEEAIALLPAEYISGERVRPNKGAAQALLARAYLYMENWANAADMASIVIDNPLYVWEPDLDKIFLKESTTTIWQLKPLYAGDNAAEGASFIFFDSPLNSALTSELLNSFDSADQRKGHWIKEVTNGTNTWYHPYKYKAHNNTGTSVEYSILFRLAEQYLIRAEARAMLGDIGGALEDLNKVRNTAGLLDLSTGSPEEIVAAVLEERRHEFFTEYGHRFFDLKRTGRLDSVLSAVKPAWQPTDRLWPLPETELLLNPNISPQNPGY